MTSTTTTTTFSWVRFFVEAGIPRSASAQYAVTFAENRIGMDMLMDLNKEYLRDMGISVLGDIIAILKHAKSVQGKITTDKVYRSSSSAHVAEEEESQSRAMFIPTLPKPVPTASEPPARVKTVPPPPSRPAAVVAAATHAVTSRLGPPAQRSFAEMGLTSGRGTRPQPPPAVTSVEVAANKSVFNRLGEAPGEVVEEERRVSMRAVTAKGMSAHRVVPPPPPVLVKPKIIKLTAVEPKSAFERLGKGMISPLPSQQRPSPPTSSGGVLRPRIREPPGSSPSSSATVVRPILSSCLARSKLTGQSAANGGKRVLFQDGGSPRDADAATRSVSQGLFANEKSVQKKKSFILVKTMRDGTQITHKLQADDPILKKIKVTKRDTPPPRPYSLPIRASQQQLQLQQQQRELQQQRVQQQRSSSGRGSDMSTREPRKRARITGPDDSSSGDRLSPIPPKRIRAHANTDFEMPPRKHLAERLGPRQSF